MRILFLTLLLITSPVTAKELETIVLDFYSPIPNHCTPKDNTAINVFSYTGEEIIPVINQMPQSYLRNHFFDIDGYFKFDRNNDGKFEGYGYGKLRHEMGAVSSFNHLIDQNKLTEYKNENYDELAGKALGLPTHSDYQKSSAIIDMSEWKCHTTVYQEGDLGGSS